MKNFLFVLIILVSNSLFGQTEKLGNAAVTKVFIKHYNAGAYDNIFSMFSKEMQEALPALQTNAFFEGLNKDVGQITDHKLAKSLGANYNSYKTTFERMTLAINLSIDDNAKINGLLVQPFVEEASTENVANKLVVSDDGLSQAQADIILKNTANLPLKTQIAMAIIENGEVKYYGVERTDMAISNIDNSKSIFEIGSITKVFTATLLSDFVNKGKLKLDDNFNDYLKLPLKTNAKITFEDLANHTSGLPGMPTNFNSASSDPANPYKEYHTENLIDYLKNSLELKTGDEKVYEYSNLGLGILGYTLSEIEGMSYDQLLHKKIFSKYQMMNSTTLHGEVEGVLVPGLDATGNEVSKWELSVLGPAGAILSNVEDLSKFALAQFDGSNKELELTRQKTFSVSETMDVGLGWHIISHESGKVLYWHNGGTGGYSSSMAIDTENKNGVILLSNVSAFNPNMGNIDKLCFGLIETIGQE